MATNEDRASVQALADQVLFENRSVLKTIDEDSVRQFVEAIIEANRIVVFGAGRMGIVSAAFAMRLAQLGFKSHVLSEPTTPAVREGDLLILSSASGETQTVYDVAVLGKDQGVRIALITARPDSRIGRLADVVVQLSVPSKVETTIGLPSIQPMATLAEQSLMLLLDIVVLLLMKATHQTPEDLWKRHRNLE
jgi:6-phospho-3-hexuloisomerase